MHPKNELRQFLTMGLGSARGKEFLFDFIVRFRLLPGENYEKLESLKKEAGCLLWKFYQTS